MSSLTQRPDSPDRPRAPRTAGTPTRPALWRLAPWRRAPLLGLRSPAAVVAVVVTTAILACAVASAPLFLSSSRSAALQAQLAPQCAEASWPSTAASFRLPQGTTPDQVQAAEAAYAQGWTSVGRQSRPVLEVTRGVGAAGNAQFGMLVRDPAGGSVTQPANLLWRPDVLANLPGAQGPGGAGVYLPASYAQALRAQAGDTITMSDVPVRVAGTYTDLFDTDPGAYWCDYGPLYLNLASANVPPPALVVPADEATFATIASAAGFVDVVQQVPVDSSRLSTTDARQLLDQAERARAAGAAAGPLPGADDGVDPRLADAVQRADTIESGLRGPVVPVAVAGGLLALVLVAAAGSFWADRRATEVRLLAARGVGPAPLAVKAALELGLPALVGAALGWAVARLLIGGLGPADDLDPSATGAALWTGVAAFVVGLTAAAVVAGLRARGTAERPLGAAPRWPAAVPWELLLLAAAAWCWVLLRSRDAIVTDAGVAQVNGLLVAFPLLGIAGTAVLLARLLTRGLPPLRRWAGRRRPAVFLAVNRLSAARLATATLLVAVTLPVAVLGYTATLTSSAQTTLDAKIGTQIGASRALVSVARIERTPAMAAVGTVVDRYNGTAGTDAATVQVLGIDPATFGRTAFWDASFADSSLDALMAELQGPAVDGRIPVVAAGLPEGDAGLRIGRVPVGAQVVDTARVLPGRRDAAPVVLVAADRLPEITSNAGSDRVSELWTDGSRSAAVQALTDAGGRISREVEPADVVSTANFLGITWTFGYLSALAVFVGVIAVGGLLLYLEARQRTRVSGYVMARRLGLSKGAHLRSMVVELGGVAAGGLVLGGLLAAGAVAVVYRRLDVDLVRPPTPLLDVPWTAVALAVVVAAAVAVLAAVYAQRAADRADPASVLREDA